MFCDLRHRMLASMSETDWSDVGVSELPTGTVTLLLADVEGSTRLWETQPDEMAVAVARLDQVLSDVVAAHDGVRPVEQGEGDSFVIAFARASDAVACALDLQRAPLAPIRLRIGINTGEVRLRDEGNYIGPTINRTARLRDLAHGGQTVLSGATEPMVVDQLPPDVSLTDLGTHPLRDLPRPERVVQLCHPDLRNEFPPLRTAKAVVSHNLPVELTSFVGRQAEIREPARGAGGNRLVTLTGAGGAGKTRLAVHVAAASGRRVRRRGLLCGSGADHPSRRRGGHGGPGVGAARSTGSLDHRHAAAASFATARCCWCWTIANTCWMPARRWSRPCWVARRG